MGSVLPLQTSSTTSPPTEPRLLPAVVRELPATTERLLPEVVRALPAVRDRLLPVAAGGKVLMLPDRVDQATAESGVVIATVIRAHSEDLVRNTLMLALAETVDSISCTQPNSTKWTRLFVNDWMAKYPYETAEDFVLFLEGIRTAKYGPLFSGRIDGAVLFEKFQKYMAEKAAFREQRVRKEHEERIRAEQEAIANATISDEERANIMKGIAEMSRAHRIAAIDRGAQPNPKREAHIAAGHAAAADAQTSDDLILAMSIYPYDDVQRAIHARAAELSIELPTREELIARAHQRARR